MPTIDSFILEPAVIIAYIFGLLLLYLICRVFFIPLKILFKLFYNAAIGAILLVVLNFVGSYFDFNLAINPFTALVVGFLGIPGLVLLVLLKLFF